MKCLVLAESLSTGLWEMTAQFYRKQIHFMTSPAVLAATDWVQAASRLMVQQQQCSFIKKENVVSVFPCFWLAAFMLRTVWFVPDYLLQVSPYFLALVSPGGMSFVEKYGSNFLPCPWYLFPPRPILFLFPLSLATFLAKKECFYSDTVNLSSCNAVEPCT